MRIEKTQTEYMKELVRAFLPDAKVFLFGSRILDELKGGDIDFLVLGERHLTNREKREIKIAFFKQFGERKIDIVTYTHEEPSTFKEIAMFDAVQL